MYLPGPQQPSWFGILAAGIAAAAGIAMVALVSVSCAIILAPIVGGCVVLVAMGYLIQMRAYRLLSTTFRGHFALLQATTFALRNGFPPMRSWGKPVDEGFMLHVSSPLAGPEEVLSAADRASDLLRSGQRSTVWRGGSHVGTACNVVFLSVVAVVLGSVGGVLGEPIAWLGMVFGVLFLSSVLSQFTTRLLTRGDFHDIEVQEVTQLPVSPGAGGLGLAAALQSRFLVNVAPRIRSGATAWRVVDTSFPPADNHHDA